MKKIAITAAALAVAVGLIVPAAATPAATQSPSATSVGTSTLQKDAHDLLRLGTPGVLAEVDTPDGQTQVRAGYGNVAAHTPVPWNPRFRIASFTKTFVATVMLQLVAEHRVSLADTVDTWLPGLVRGHGNDGRAITVHELLQQTSGLSEFLQEYPDLFTERGFQAHRYDTVTQVQAVKAAMKLPPVFKPGTKWSYSNTNYVLAGLIIQRATGHTWRYEVQHRIVAPLGLRDTYTPDTYPLIPGPHAIGYERFPRPGSPADKPVFGKAIDATDLNPSWASSAGAIISTPEDTNRFLQALIRGKLLPPAQLRAMQTTVATAADFQKNWPGSRYGLGLLWIPNSCGGSWAHGGDIQGFMTRNGVSPDGKRSVVVTLNTDSPVPNAGVPTPAHDITRPLIDHALCGKS